MFTEYLLSESSNWTVFLLISNLLSFRENFCHLNFCHFLNTKNCICCEPHGKSYKKLYLKVVNNLDRKRRKVPLNDQNEVSEIFSKWNKWNDWRIFKHALLSQGYWPYYSNYGYKKVSRAVTSKLMTKENGAGCLSRFDSSISHFCLSSETMPLCLMNVPVGGLLILRTLFGFWLWVSNIK